MKKILMRGLSAFLCLVLITSGVPVFADDTGDVVIADIIPSDPTAEPTEAPTQEPTQEPEPTLLLTNTAEPTQVPTEVPTQEPTEIPTQAPTQEPVETATAEPSSEPTVQPSAEASAEPTVVPSLEPSVEPSVEPSLDPSAEPSVEPTLSPEELALQQEAQLNEVVSLWLSAMGESNCSSDFDRAFWFYASLIANAAPGGADSAYAVLVEGSANSLGYARALEKLMTAAGMECIVITDANDPSIAWNMAKLDGQWTHIDAAMDDASGKPGAHFGLTDAAMALDHSWNGDVPACTSAQSNYYVLKEDYLAVESHEALAAILTQAAETGADELYVYNAASIDLETSVTEILAEIAPAALSFVDASGLSLIHI